MYKIDLEKEDIEIARRYRDLLHDTYQYLSDEDKSLIRKAFDVAKDAHKDQRRKSGEPYLYHPIAVAKIVAYDIGLGAIGIAAGLMHDVVEDSDDYTVNDMQNLFGNKIATIIDGLTKIEFIKHQDVSVQTENYRKLLLTLSEDVRVILVKLADRLHNMRTMDFMPPHKQIKIASETLFIYAPLAHRLGLYSIKTELENLSLKYTEPKLYKEIKFKLNETKEERENYISDFSQKVKERLDEEEFEYTIKGRPKSIYSIYKKMTSKNVSFEEVYDKFAIRIIFKSTKKSEKFNAWKIYSIVTDNFKPNPSRLRDWISQPKSTGYEALHTTVMGLNNRWVEIQIRSFRMDEIAEKGIATHYKYKHSGETESNLEVWINKIKDVIENENLESNDFIDNVKLNLYSKEIFVFTPNGDLKSLPKGSTALDFAYDIHSKIGDTCSGAKINSILRPISHVLKSGDNVDIITLSTQKPTQNWLDIVQTSRAKSKIKTALKEERKKVAQYGKEILSRKLRHLKINLNDATVNSLATYFKCLTSQDVFYKVGTGQIDSKDLRSFADDSQGGIYNIFKRFRRKQTQDTPIKKPETNNNLDLLVFGPDDEKLDYTLANCCNPIVGDDVFGFISVNQGLKLHKENCPNSISLRANYNYRILKAKWVDSSNLPFTTKIHIKGLDRTGIVNDITNLITRKLNVELKGINLNSNDGIFDGKLDLHVKSKNDLKKVLSELMKIKGIKKIDR